MPIKMFNEGQYGFVPEQSLPEALDVENLARIAFDAYNSLAMSPPIWNNQTPDHKAFWVRVAEAVCQQVYGDLSEMLGGSEEEEPATETDDRKPIAWWYRLDLGPSKIAETSGKALKDRLFRSMHENGAKPEY